MMYSLDEIALLPSSTPVRINHRSECDCNIDTTLGKKLPIFVSPMTCILNDRNFDIFEYAGFIPIYPRWKDSLDHRINICTEHWVAMGLDEFTKTFLGDERIPMSSATYHVLIDMANGHMEVLYNRASMAKQIYGSHLELMVGNIADVGMYEMCCKCGIDWVRVSIGTGTGCTTGVQTGIHVSMPKLLNDIKQFKKDYTNATTKVIADGGLNTPDRMIKCLALGADAIMIGYYAACSKDASGFYYGQASEAGQIDMFGEAKRNPEGVRVSTTKSHMYASDMAEYLSDVMRTAMSYTGAKTIAEFQKNTRWDVMTLHEFQSYYK